MKEKFDELKKAQEDESSHSIGYNDMIWPGSKQFHPTMVTVMGQVNQALTGYGAVSVYGPQIFELLGLGVTISEYLTQGNYVSYFFLMTLAWLLIDRVGRRAMMIWGAFGMATSFLILTLLGGLAQNADKLNIPDMPIAIVGSIILFIATGIFGIGWLSQPWLIPTEVSTPCFFFKQRGQKFYCEYALYLCIIKRESQNRSSLRHLALKAPPFRSSSGASPTLR